MEPKKIIIGTRGSKLALVQTNLVADALRHAHPGLTIETAVITTKGDVNQSPIPLDTVGKTWFTEEIENALLDGSIDIAVHSLKDLPPDLPAGLMIVTALPRADAADVLIAKDGTHLKNLKHGAIVGTDSARRKALLLAVRPDLDIQSIRGNVDTRLRKLETEHYDAIVLAAAGLARLGITDPRIERLDPETFVPAPGQGILAVEFKKERIELLEMLDTIVHEPTAMAAAIEGTFSNAVGGGCKLPVGCYAKIDGERVTIHAVTGNASGDEIRRGTKEGAAADGKVLAETMAGELKQGSYS